MADVLLIGVREEDKADFIVELIKGLMSRGLTVSYAGAYYCESEDSLVYDDITNLLFFASTYFREAQMKSKNFKNWEHFLDNVNFEQTDARLIIYVNTCTREIELENYFKDLEKDFTIFLENRLKDLIVELIRNSFGMSFSAFESHYPEIVEILGINRKLIRELRNQAEKKAYEIDREWESEVFGLFINNCVKIRNEIEKKGLMQIEKELQKKKAFKIDIPRKIRDISRNYIDLKKEHTDLKKEHTDIKKKKERSEKDLSRLKEIEKELEEIEKELALLENEEEFAQLENKIFEKGKPEDSMLEELKVSQENLEIECFKDPSKSKELIWEFFGPEKILEAVRNRERAMYFDIFSRTPKKKILCIYYEEGGVGKINLYFYPEESTKEDKIPRSQLEGFDRPKDVYTSENIGHVIDEHIMLALHPSLADICFPDNDFLLEVDPEEPEIGLLSKRITMNEFERLDENLKISPDLEKVLYIYRLGEDEEEEIGKRPREDEEEEIGKKFHRIGHDYGTNKQKEDILILGRIEYLYRMLITSDHWRLIYSDALFILRWLAILLPPLAIILHFSLKYSFQDIFWVIGALMGTAFSFWTLKTFALNYLLEPIYNILKWASYICLAAIILGRIEFFGMIFLVIFLIFLLLCAGMLSAKYIRSAVLYELNESFKIIGYNDTVEVENPNEIVNILKCTRFQTIIRKGDDRKGRATEAFFNSEFFPRIRCVQKKIRTFPREMAYSSGIYLYSKEQQKEDKFSEELTYRKPKAGGSWRILKNILLDKGQIESRKNTDSEYSPSERLIYFGQWDSVMKKVAGSIPLFPQSVLFRSMIILAVVSVLIFYFFFSYRTKTLEINFLEIALFLIISSISIFVAWKLKIRPWRVLLVLILYFFLLIQLHIMIPLAIFLFIFFVYLFKFLVKQMVFYLMIWACEKCVGNMISIYEDQEGEGNMENPLVMRGTEIKKNPLVTQLSMRLPTGLEEKRIYLNEVFFCNILMSDRWHLKTDIDNDSTRCKILFFSTLDFIERNYLKLKKLLQIRR